MLSQQDRALIAGADPANADRISLESFVAEVGSAKCRCSGGDSLQKLSTSQTDRLVEVVCAELFFFGGQVEWHVVFLFSKILRTGRPVLSGRFGSRCE